MRTAAQNHIIKDRYKKNTFTPNMYCILNEKGTVDVYRICGRTELIAVTGFFHTLSTYGTVGVPVCVERYCYLRGGKICFVRGSIEIRLCTYIFSASSLYRVA